MIDSLVKTIDGDVYRALLGRKLPELMFHIVTSVSKRNQNALRKVRQTWNYLLSAHVLNELDSKLKTIDSSWPLTSSQRKLTGEIQELEKEVAVMQQEVAKLKIQAMKESQANSRKESPRNVREESKENYHNQSRVENVDANGPMEFSERKIKRGCDSTFDETPPKKTKIEGNSSTPEEDHKILFLQQSSVLLTPSPEPLKSPSLSSEQSSDSNDNTFWVTYNETISSCKSNSPTLMDPNVELPFFFNSSPNLPKIDESNRVECVKPELLNPSVENINSKPDAVVEENVKENVVQAYEPFEIDFNVSATGSFINFESNDETLTAISNIDQLEPIDEVNNSTESLRTTSPPLVISIDGTIECQAITPIESSKQIKINLLNPMVIEDSKSESTAQKIAETEIKQKQPSEWETPKISYEVKDSMKNATFYTKPIYRKGVEQSGMCSIM